MTQQVDGRSWREKLVARAPRPPRPSDYPSQLHSEKVAARVGLWLGIAFLLCFVTGLFSHFIQHPAGWFGWPARPVWLYRLTQGLHVTSGVAAIPLLLIKLWTVSPRFWKWPPVTSLLNAIERGSIFLLVASAFFQLISGLLNVAEWYPWKFFFPSVHYAISYVAIGSLLIHVAVKLPVIRRAFGESVSAVPEVPGLPASTTVSPTAAPPTGSAPAFRAAPPTDKPADSFAGPLSRRGLLGLAAGSVAVAVIATVGDKIPALRAVSVLAQRSGTGPQGLPVNRSAAAAGVTTLARSPDWSLQLTGPVGRKHLSLDDLMRLPQVTADLPISCVEGWSQEATWTGVRLRDLLALVGGQNAAARVHSIENGLYGSSDVTAELARDDLTLIALRLGREPLDIDHGYPARLIAPSRPGALQTKWLNRIEVTS